MNPLFALSQGHDVAAEIFGAGNEVVEDAHDAFEATDCSELIKLPCH